MWSVSPDAMYRLDDTSLNAFANQLRKKYFEVQQHNGLLGLLRTCSSDNISFIQVSGQICFTFICIYKQTLNLLLIPLFWSLGDNLFQVARGS